MVDLVRGFEHRCAVCALPPLRRGNALLDAVFSGPIRTFDAHSECDCVLYEKYDLTTAAIDAGVHLHIYDLDCKGGGPRGACARAVALLRGPAYNVPLYCRNWQK